ncbi:hypothetical protein D039_2023B, partial [Vibrio parahaemolyticus EKP-028]
YCKRELLVGIVFSIPSESIGL